MSYLQPAIEFLQQFGLYGLFVSGVLSGSILPFNSEAVLTILVLAGVNPFTCVAVASVANTIGGLSVYYLGYLGKIEWIEKYAKVKMEKIEAILPKLQRWGAIMGLFSFVPIFGDVVVLGLGFFRVQPVLSMLFLFVGKALRYYLIAQALLYFV